MQGPQKEQGSFDFFKGVLLKGFGTGLMGIQNRDLYDETRVSGV